MRSHWAIIVALCAVLLAAGCVRDASPNRVPPGEFELPTWTPTGGALDNSDSGDQPTLPAISAVTDEPLSTEVEPSPVITEITEQLPTQIPTLTPLPILQVSLTPTISITVVNPQQGDTLSVTQVPIIPGPVDISTATTAPTLTPITLTTPIITPTSIVNVVLPDGTTAEPLAVELDSECVYVVTAGDNLFRIAVTNNVTVNAMREANPGLVGNAPILQPGQELNLPDCGVNAPTPTPAPPSAQATAGSTAPDGSFIHVVGAGDTLFALALRYGTTVPAIVAANELSNADALSLGQELIIPVEES